MAAVRRTSLTGVEELAGIGLGKAQVRRADLGQLAGVQEPAAEPSMAPGRYQ
jgi:hypothetical protein